MLAINAAGESGIPRADLDAAELAGAGFRLQYQEILAGSPHEAGGERASP